MSDSPIVLVTFNDHAPVFPGLSALASEWQKLLYELDLYDGDRRQLRPGERQPTQEERNRSKPEIIIRIFSFVKGVRHEMAEFGTATCLHDFPDYVTEENGDRPTTMTIPTTPPEHYRLEYPDDVPYRFPDWFQDEAGILDRAWQRASADAEADRQARNLP